jgi:MFS family permease
MGVYGFVCAGGSALGALLGGVLTGGFGWAAIFMINLPVGLVVMGLAWLLLTAPGRRPDRVRLDLFGAVSATAAMMVAVAAIVNGNRWGWTSGPVLGFAAAAVVLFGLFLWGQKRAQQPLVPLSLFRIRSVVVANLVVMLWAAALFTWFFMTSLYLYFVQGYQPVQIGLAFLPTNITMGLLSLGLSGLLVHAFGLRWPLAVGLAVAAAGLFLLSGVPVGADFNRDLLPGLLLFGVGAGLAVNPMLMAAVCEVPERDSGVASGVVNSSFSMGGALWLAIFTSYAAWTTQSVGGPEGGGLEALNSGYKAAFFGAACLLSLAAVVTALGLKGPHRAPRAAPILEERYESLE